MKFLILNLKSVLNPGHGAPLVCFFFEALKVLSINYKVRQRVSSNVNVFSILTQSLKFNSSHKVLKFRVKIKMHVLRNSPASR